MELWLWSDVEENHDSVFLGVSTDGTSFVGDYIRASTRFEWARELLDFNWRGGVVGQPSVWVGLEFVSDSSGNAYYGSYVEDVLIRKTSCGSPSIGMLNAEVTAASGANYTVSWSATSPLDTYELDEATNPSFTGATTHTGTGTSASFSHTVATPTNYYYRVRATDLCGGLVYASASSNTGTTLVIPPQTLTVMKSGTGSGTVSSDPAGITCGATCSSSFSYNTVVTLSAAPDAGSTFAGWSGEGCSGAGTCQVTMSQARNVTASFLPPVQASMFYTVSPCRLFDTRFSTGPQAAAPALAPGETRTLSVGTRCGVSSATVRSLSVNQTVTAPGADGELVLFRGDLESVPISSHLSYRAGKTRANNGILELSRTGDGTFKVHNRSAGSVHFILDVNGKFQ